MAQRPFDPTPKFIPPPPFPPKYQMGRLLGEGHFAKVYAARRIHDGAAMAVKAIKKPPTTDAQKIFREVEAMCRLHHPNILRLHEVFPTHSTVYLVMERARGGNLESKLERSGGRLPEPAALRYFQQLAAALYYCHKRGVTHRDIKPDNILLDERDNVKLSDFGVSFAAAAGHEHTLLHTVCGMRDYLAPEVALCRRGGGYDGAKADAWSCGLVLFELLVGNRSFVGKNLSTMFQMIPANISNLSRKIIARLLDPNPKSRMSIEALMETGWLKNPH